MSNLDPTAMRWRKSSRSTAQGECVEVAAAAWRKSSHSGAQGECVEVAGVESMIAMRDSKDPAGGHLLLTTREWGKLLAALKGL